MLLRLIGLSSCLALSLAEPTPGADDGATPPATPTRLPAKLAGLLETHGGERPETADAHDALVALSRRNRHRPPPTLREKPKGVCPPELEATVNATGMLSVDHFRSARNVTCDEATRLAINMTANCGGSVYFPTPCDFASTVVVPGGTSLTGGGGALLLLPLTPGASPADGSRMPQLLGETSSRSARKPPSRARPPGLPSSSSTSRTSSSTTSRLWATTPG